MFQLYGITEIAFPVCWQGDDGPTMRRIVKHLRRRQQAGKATGCGVSGPLNRVNPHLRCFGIAARGFSCQRTGDTVSAVPYNGNML